MTSRAAATAPTSSSPRMADSSTARTAATTALRFSGLVKTVPSLASTSSPALARDRRISSSPPTENGSSARTCRGTTSPSSASTGKAANSPLQAHRSRSRCPPASGFFPDHAKRHHSRTSPGFVSSPRYPCDFLSLFLFPWAPSPSKTPPRPEVGRPWEASRRICHHRSSADRRCE